MFLFAKPLQEDTLSRYVLIYNLPTSFFIHPLTISFYQSSDCQYTGTFTCTGNDSQRGLNSTYFQILLRVGQQLSTRQEIFLFFSLLQFFSPWPSPFPSISIPSVIYYLLFPFSFSAHHASNVEACIFISFTKNKVRTSKRHE